MTDLIVNPLDLTAVKLKGGGHNPGGTEFCVNEAAAYMAGEPWSASPKCVAPTISRFTMRWNDAAWESDEARTEHLGRYLKPASEGGMLGTRTNAQDERTRAWLATDWAVRISAPAWLRAAGMVEQAEKLEELPELTRYDRKTTEQLRSIRNETWAVRTAAWSGYREKFLEEFRKAWDAEHSSPSGQADAAAAADAAATTAAATAAAATAAITAQADAQDADLRRGVRRHRHGGGERPGDGFHDHIHVVSPFAMRGFPAEPRVA